MAIIGEIKTDRIGDDPNEQEFLEVKFTNGTLAQLRELVDFVKSEGINIKDDPVDVLKVAISFLLTVKENKQKPKE